MEIKEVGHRVYRKKYLNHYERKCRKCGTTFEYDDEEILGRPYLGYYINCPACDYTMAHSDYNPFIKKAYNIEKYIIEDGKPKLIDWFKKKCIF